jgi:hypothetical protein
MADGKKQESSTILAQLAHRFWQSERCGEQQIGFTFPFV